MSLRNLFACAFVAVFAVAPAFAQLQSSSTLFAYEDAAVESGFNITFPDFGIDSTSRIIYTRFNVDIDEEKGTARFSAYDQMIEPLLMPLGISTGTLHIRIESSEGTFDKATNTFQTNDLYNITFTNDLSVFGFESPVIIPSVSTGRVTTDAEGVRRVELDWVGEGELANEETPSEPYKYTYSCSTRTVVADSAADVPPLPTQQSCASGIASIFSFAFGAIGFAGLKRSVRRRRR